MANDGHGSCSVPLEAHTRQWELRADVVPLFHYRLSRGHECHVELRIPITIDHIEVIRFYIGESGFIRPLRKVDWHCWTSSNRASLHSIDIEQLAVTSILGCFSMLLKLITRSHSRAPSRRDAFSLVLSSDQALMAPIARAKRTWRAKVLHTTYRRYLQQLDSVVERALTRSS